LRKTFFSAPLREALERLEAKAPHLAEALRLISKTPQNSGL
jgi:hypothetical protein